MENLVFLIIMIPCAAAFTGIGVYAMKRKKPVPVEEEEVVMCSNCGEAPAVKGHDLCEECLREQKREAELELMADKLRADEADMPIEEDIDEDSDDEE